MSKYHPVRHFLENAATSASEMTLTFQQTEQILCFALPASARKHRAWWANEYGPSAHIQAKSWLSAGWEVDTVDQVQDWVRFRRSR